MGLLNKWDHRYMARAKSISAWSKHPKHKVGAVIVDPKYFQVSEGYNGPPRLLNDIGLSKSSRVLRTLHAELNALLQAKEPVEGFTMYVYPFSPCAQCAAAIIQKGISKVVYFDDSNLITWKVSQNEALQMFTEAHVKFINYSTKVKCSPPGSFS